MKRRMFLTAAATGVAGGMAGCSAGSPSEAGGTDTGSTDRSDGGSAPFEHAGTLDVTFATNREFPADEDPADGKPPSFEDPPASPDVDPGAFDTIPVNGESVRLAPIDVVEAWYYRGEARFVDARGLEQYTRAHVYGAVSSPAQRNSAGGGIDGWPTGDRVVTYCRCPHHLSSIRAAGLQKVGFSRVFAIDEGFGAWMQRDDPMAGTRFGPGDDQVASYTLSGQVDPRFAGEYVWASAGRQYEAAPVQPDGGFELTLHFDASPETPVSLVTPEQRLTRPLGDLQARF